MKALMRLLAVVVAAFGAARAVAAPTVSLSASPYQKPGPGDDVVVAASVDQIAGVTAMDLAVSYDPVRMAPISVFHTTLTGGCVMTSSFATPGIVAVHFTTPAPLSGTGDVAWITFRLAQAQNNTSIPLSWLQAFFNGSATGVQMKSLSLSIGSAPSTIGAPRNAAGLHNTQVSIPILATSLSPASSFDLVLTYDPAVLAAVRVDKTALSNCMSMNTNLSVAGTVRISLYGLCTVSGSGSLVNVVFNVVGANGSRTPLNVVRGGADEGAVPTVLADGLFNTCGTPDMDGDGYSICAGDCNDGNAAVNPGAIETCNGLDDDCDGIVDNAPTPVGVPVVGMDPENGNTRISWTPIASASNYDVVRGSLLSLGANQGDFSQSTDACVVSNLAATTYLDNDLPAPGGADWYLVRPRNCGGGGSYDDASVSQSSPRDAGINAASSSCP